MNEAGLDDVESFRASELSRDRNGEDQGAVLIDWYVAVDGARLIK